MTAAATSTWAVTTWIEQAVLEQTPLVSVILPTHNRSHLLPRAVSSVRSQVYANWEIVVVDDGSTDDTPRVLERLGDELGPERLKALRTPPGGVCAARNHGLAVAKGSLITYLDDDNAMHPLWLKAVAWVFWQRSDVDVLYGGVIVDDFLRLNRRSAGALPSYHLVAFDRARIVQENLADIGAIAHRSGLPEARFDETLREITTGTSASIPPHRVSPRRSSSGWAFIPCLASTPSRSGSSPPTTLSIGPERTEPPARSGL